MENIIYYNKQQKSLFILSSLEGHNWQCATPNCVLRGRFLSGDQTQASSMQSLHSAGWSLSLQSTTLHLNPLSQHAKINQEIRARTGSL